MAHHLSGPEKANLESGNCRVVSAGFGELGESLAEQCPHPHGMQSQGTPTRRAQEFWLCQYQARPRSPYKPRTKSARRIQAESKGKDLTSPQDRWRGARRASDSSFSQCSCFHSSLIQGHSCTVTELTLHTSCQPPGRWGGCRTCWCHQYLDTTWDIWACVRFGNRS